MGNSLTEQLLKAGLVNKKQANKVKQEQYQQKKKKKPGKKKGETTVPESKQMARQAQEKQRQRAKQLNRERQQEESRKESTAQINQMIGSSKLKIGNGELTYNFADGSKIKKIYISKEIREQLGKGQLAIVKGKGQYQVVPAQVAEKIAGIDATSVIAHNTPSKGEAEDDPYAEFPIPEDLEW